MSRNKLLTRYFARRLALGLLTLWGIGTITFVAVRVVADPVEFLAGQMQSQQSVDVLRQRLGLDRPLLEQYFNYGGAVLQGDFGESFRSGRPVSTEILERLPATLELLVTAMAVAVVVGLVLAVLGVSAGSAAARLGDLTIQAGSAFPPFWVGLLLIYALYFRLGVAPAPIGRIDSGLVPPPSVTGSVLLDSLIAGDMPALVSAGAHIVLPVVTLVIMLTPSILQVTRATLRSVMESDYIRTARACGLPRRTVRRYAVKNVSVSMVHIIAISFGSGLSGVVMAEVVFSWPGIGLYAVQAMNAADYAPIQGIVLVSAAIYVVLFNIADALAAIIDPRITLT